MPYMSFAEVQTAFTTENPTQHFKCIAKRNPKSNENDCPNNIELGQKYFAGWLLQKPQEKLNADELRDIINCLLCASCQHTYTEKNRVKYEWSGEFPLLDFTKTKAPSPYSLYGKWKKKRKSGDTSARSLSSSLSNATPSSEERYRSTYLRCPPPQPYFTPTEGRSLSDSAVNPTPESIDIDASATSSREFGNGSIGIAGESPALERARRRNNGGRATTPISAPPDVSLDLLSCPGGFPMEEASTQTPAEELRLEADNTHWEESRTAAACHNPFHPGAGSTWSPWKIRDEVLAILFEPLPKPKGRGVIYAAEVKNTRYVKIGITTGKAIDRLKNVAKEHGLEINTGTIIQEMGIPYIQLLRLEALVHADLAYFQRDLRKSRRHKTHREYFEIDLATAKRTIALWWKIMQKHGLEPGRELDRRIWKGNDDEMAKPSDWHDLNSNHALREMKWEMGFEMRQDWVQKLIGYVGFVLTAFMAFALCGFMFFLGLISLPLLMGLIIVSGLGFLGYRPLVRFVASSLF